MRIEKIEFSNLNSLVGHFSIDLTHPDLSSAGMFVISGPTGAGKTTILDAIAYGLYGKTPRLNRISQDRNELMSKDARDCMALVTFEVHGERYRALTSQKRTISAQKDYAEVVRRLYKVAADGSEQELLRKEVTAKVEQLTGLTFENFKRCMMLAQGEFAKFLKANKNERAEVLATITGTEIYDRIGQYVFERHAELERRSKDLKQQEKEVLPEAALAAKLEERARLEALVETTRAAVEACNKALAWLERVKACEVSCHEAESALAQAEQGWRAFQEGEEARLLARARAAEKVSPFAEARDAALSNRQEAQQLLAQAESGCRELQAQQEAARLALEQVQTRCAGRLPQLEEAAQKVRELLIPLEKSMAGVRSRLSSCRELCRTEEKNDKEAQAAVAQAAAAQAQHAEEMQRLLAQQRQLLPDKDLPAVLRSALSRLADVRELAPGGAAALPALEGVLAQLEANAAACEELLRGRSRESLAAEVQALGQILRARDEQEEAAKAWRQAQAACAAAEEKQAALPPQEAAEQRLQEAEQAVERLLAVCDIQEKLADLYARFCRHEFDTCPCCGAAAPGAAPAHVESGMLAAAQRQRDLLREQRNALAQQHHTARVEVAAARARADETQQLALKRAAEVQALEAAYAAPLPEPLPGAVEQGRRALQQLDTLLRDKAELERARVFAERCAAFLQEVRPYAAEVPASLAEAEALVAELRRRAEAYAELAAALEKARAAEAKDGERCVQIAQVAAAARLRLDAAAAARLAVEAEWEALLVQRRELGWDGVSAHEALAQLDAEQKSLEKERLHAQEALLQVRETLEQRQQAVNTLRGGLNSAEALLAEAVAKFLSALQSQGFADEAAYGEARGGISRLPELEQRRAALEKALTEARAQAAARREVLTRCRAEALTAEEAGALLQRRAQLEEQGSAHEGALRALLAELAVDAANREANAQTLALQQEVLAQAESWRLLRDVLLIDGTKAGFRRYAQQMTFDCLISSANAQLAALSDRYVLFQSPGSEFGLHVVDRWSGDENGRDSANLSGGEAFIVSLALALGLSRLAGSNTSIDTLFLDEGFGTLDADKLEEVLNCLESLRAEGKLIGIISHVPRLKERLPESARLELCRVPGTARSTIAPHPAVTART